MKRGFWIATVVVAVLAMTALPALAAGGKWRHRLEGTRFALVGEVTAIESPTITVKVLKGSLEGEVVPVSTDVDTRFRDDGADCPDRVIDFADVEDAYEAAILEENALYVSVNGFVNDDGVYLANRVTVVIPLAP